MLSSTYALFSLAVSAAGFLTGGPPAAEAPPQAIAGAEQPNAAPAATFVADSRAVSNWRAEAVQDLVPTPLSALAVALRAERPVITRCVKLNNYWCIKSARWIGEIGTDDEGHVGFASADQGADAAVRLLRRYYLDFDRKSALDIVRRWAPAECRVAGGSSMAPAVLAIRGIGNTLRARWLGARKSRPMRTKVAAAGPVPIPSRPSAGRVSAVPLRPLPSLQMPSIMAGMSAPKASVAAALPARVPQRRQPTPASVAAATKASAARAAPSKQSRPANAAALPAKLAVTGSVPAKGALAPPPRLQPVAAASPPPASPLTPRPAAACSPDEQRIQNYAGRMVNGLDVQPGDDLKLFADDGRPLPNLARVLLAMSAFELGYLRASVELVEAAIARATPRPAQEPEQNRPAPTEPVL